MQKHLLIFSVLALLVLSLAACKAELEEIRIDEDGVVYSEVLGWRIRMPEDFEEAPEEFVNANRERGQARLEETMGMEFDDDPTLIFSYRKGLVNMFSAGYIAAELEPTAPLKTKNEAAGFAIMETMKDQFPEAEVSSHKSTVLADGVEFLQFFIDIEVGNGYMIHMVINSTRVKIRDLTISMVYIDEAAGEQMLSALAESQFD